MLVANIDVPHNFANGTSGRIVHWGPDVEEADGSRRVVLANVPGVQARFYTEEAWASGKKHFLPEIDFIDLEPRRETVATARGKPTMLQLTLQPAYALTIHKVQSLTIRITVQGCLEGVFALGQVYVLSSRVTDPAHFQLVGVPPEDLLEEVAQAWREAGLDVDACFAKAAEVTNEWTYTPAGLQRNPCENVRRRFKPVAEEQRRVPLRLQTLAVILNPQPAAAEVLHGVLDWIDRCDQASQAQQPPPPAARSDGTALFPDHEWWLTDFGQRRPANEGDANMEGEVTYDEDALTRKPEDAWWHSDGSESCSSADAPSDGSLPAGPHTKATKGSVQTTRQMSSGVQQMGRPTAVPGTSPGLAPRRRLRGKQAPVRATAFQADAGDRTARSLTQHHTYRAKFTNGKMFYPSVCKAFMLVKFSDWLACGVS